MHKTEKSIYEAVMKPSYKKRSRSDDNCTVQSIKKRGEPSPSNTYSEMSMRSDRRRKRYADNPKNRSQPTCIIHGPRHQSYK